MQEASRGPHGKTIFMKSDSFLILFMHLHSVITSQYSSFPTLRNVADLQAKFTENEKGSIIEIMYF